MCDLTTWRVRIGHFHLTVTSKLANRARDSWVSSESCNEVGVSAIDIVMAFCYCVMVGALVASFELNVKRLLAYKSTWCIEEMISSGTMLWDSNVFEFCNSGSVSPCILHVTGIVMMTCGLHAVYSLWRLRLSGDVEENPGPQHADLKAEEKSTGAVALDTDDIVKKIMQSLQQQLHEQTNVIRNDLRDIKTELGQVKDKCVEINQRCDRLEREQRDIIGTVSVLSTDVSSLHEEMMDSKEETCKLTVAVDDLKEDINRMKTELDILEQHSRRDNLRLFGIPYRNDREDYDTCVTAVIDALNSTGGPKKWAADDIVRAAKF